MGSGSSKGLQATQPQQATQQILNGTEYWTFDPTWTVWIPMDIDTVMHPDQSHVIIRAANGSLTAPTYKNPRFFLETATGDLMYTPPASIPVLTEANYKVYFCRDVDGISIYKSECRPLDWNSPEAYCKPLVNGHHSIMYARSVDAIGVAMTCDLALAHLHGIPYTTS